MNEEVANILTKNLIPKEFEKNQFGEVFTPLYFIEQMLDELPASVWKDKSLKWFDPACGIGNFPIVVYYRLMESLRGSIAGDAARSKHIIEKMLFMNELNKKNVANCKKIFAMIDPKASPNIECKDFLKIVEGKYDIIIGNPPYNEARIKETSDQPLYSKFIMKAIDMTTKLLFVVPSRWFAGGKGLDDFRKSMLMRKDIVSIHHIPNSRTIWPQIDITGGVNYFYLNKSYNGLTKFTNDNKTREIQLDKYDILVRDPTSYPMINNALKHPCLTKLYLSSAYFGITTNFEHLRTTKGGGVKCYVSVQKGGVKYVDPKYIKNRYDFWKVFTPKNNGGSDGFGKLIIGSPSEVASQTYIGFKVGSSAEAKSLKSYLETDYANYMLSLRKIDQNISETTLKWIPLPPLDRVWTDAKVAKYFGVPINRTIRVRRNGAKTVKQRKP
jgi:site-specific DNA-methyltransferase (adenine-specific)